MQPLALEMYLQGSAQVFGWPSEPTDQQRPPPDAALSAVAAAAPADALAEALAEALSQVLAEALAEALPVAPPASSSAPKGAASSPAPCPATAAPGCLHGGMASARGSTVRVHQHSWQFGQAAPSLHPLFLLTYLHGGPQVHGWPRDPIENVVFGPLGSVAVALAAAVGSGRGQETAG